MTRAAPATPIRIFQEVCSMQSVLALIRSLINKILTFFHLRPASDVVVYYGCPNSSKAKKLQLRKKSCR